MITRDVIGKLPELHQASLLEPGPKRAFIGAYGFEPRAIGWCNRQNARGGVLNAAFMFRYLNPKGPNRIEELKSALVKLGASKPHVIRYDILLPQPSEDAVMEEINVDAFDEIVVDISAMTKLLILLVLFRIRTFTGRVRIVYSEAEEYCPTREAYDPISGQMASTARFPSRGAEQIVRLQCLSSIRMQGQPVTLVAFASFNEKLVSHMLGTLSPHRLILINGKPPRPEYSWRERATLDIHRRLCLEYGNDNPLDDRGLLVRVASTLDYRESLTELEAIYEEFGLFERIICGATGSKMQTVGLLLFKLLRPEVQVEYPTPDSYYFKDLSKGIREVHEVVFPNFYAFVRELSTDY
ncbi:MAG: hypothetical protein WDN28_27915 [Chthoniobacter sp.]